MDNKRFYLFFPQIDVFLPPLRVGKKTSICGKKVKPLIIHVNKYPFPLGNKSNLIEKIMIYIPVKKVTLFTADVLYLLEVAVFTEAKPKGKTCYRE